MYFDQESFKFLMDPMLTHGAEKVSAMGYGNAINAFSDRQRGGSLLFAAIRPGHQPSARQHP